MSGCFLPRLFMSVTFFLVFVFAVSIFWPEGREVLQLMLIPGTPEDLAKAVSYLSATPDITVQVEAEYAAKEAEA